VVYNNFICKFFVCKKAITPIRPTPLQVFSNKLMQFKEKGQSFKHYSISSKLKKASQIHR
jgi:hypothetical protein